MRIRNWRKFQHYGDRRIPPWIKLHVELLSSTDWVMWDDASRVLAIACMLIASRHNGYLPKNCTPEYIKRVAYLSRLPNFKPLIECGFLEATDDASNTLADASTALAESLSLSVSLGSKKERKKSLIEEPQEFLDFWASVPKKKGRHEAMLKYVEAINNGADPLQLNAAAKRWNVDMAKTEEKYVALPATWLNKRRYLDYHTEPEQESNLEYIEETKRWQWKAGCEPVQDDDGRTDVS